MEDFGNAPTLQQIRERTDALVPMMHDWTAIIDPVMRSLADEVSQRMHTVSHHLGWAHKFYDGGYVPTEGPSINHIQAIIALIQAEHLIQQMQYYLTNHPTAGARRTY